MALALFGQSPNVYGHMTEEERRWYEPVLRRALEIDQDRRRALIEAVGASVGNEIAKRMR